MDLFSIYNQINKDLSFLIYNRQKKTAGFAVSRIVNYNPTVIEVPYFSVLEKYQKSPVFALLIIVLISNFFEKNDRIIIFCVDNNNNQMNVPIKKILNDIIRTQKSQIIYVKKK